MAVQTITGLRFTSWYCWVPRFILLDGGYLARSNDMGFVAAMIFIIVFMAHWFFYGVRDHDWQKGIMPGAIAGAASAMLTLIFNL